ncbi:hypothetical protein ADL21_11295 [Streptomyces albus subsp. albus]|nr:hypothetical protein ADL21_11295 [Streptomyces albus subsp. albus]
MATKIFENKDASSKVTIAVFREEAPTAQNHFTDFACSVANDMVVVGGGAIGAELPAGALLTASYPSADRSAWLASSKDHLAGNPHKIQAFAVGLRIDGLSRSDLLGHLEYYQTTSDRASHPQTTLGAGGAFTVISGGFRVNWTGAGNLATASFPETGNTWRARSKDHEAGAPCTLTLHSIGIRTNLPVGRVERGQSSQISAQAAHPSVETRLPGGFALTGIGAETTTTGSGQLLWRLEPIDNGAAAASKDHLQPSPGTVKAFALGIKIV